MQNVQKGREKLAVCLLVTENVLEYKKQRGVSQGEDLTSVMMGTPR